MSEQVLLEQTKDKCIGSYKSTIAMNEDSKTKNERNKNKQLKQQDKNSSFEHHNQVQRTNITDLIDQVSSRQGQIF